MPSFVVTTATNEVAVDRKTRTGTIPVTVSNISGRPVRIRLNLVPTPPAEAAWLGVTGEAEREFANGASDQFTVQVTVPPTAPAGTYTFKPVAAAEDRPMEEFTDGPTLSVKVEAPDEKKPFPWWLVAVGVGVLLLAVLIIVLLSRDGDENGPTTTTTSTTTTAPPRIKSQGTGVIHGTFLFDFDAGQETQAGADVFWEQITAQTRQLAPRGGAQLSRLGAVNFDNVSLTDLRNASYSTAPIVGSNVGDQMPAGTVIAVRTNDGAFAKVLIEARDVAGTRPGIPARNNHIRVRWVTFEGS
ncbi:MAG: hypothetical protein M3326_04180 [Actinomycetota bacterium]|nr:hypothetical protein [Actinomycetota bacterium]